MSYRKAGSGAGGGGGYISEHGNPAAFEAHPVTSLRLIDSFTTSAEVGADVVINLGAVMSAATATERLVHLEVMGEVDEGEMESLAAGTRGVNLETSILRQVEINNVNIKMPTPCPSGETRVYACTFMVPGGSDGLANTAWPEHVATNNPSHPMCHFVAMEGEMAIPFSGPVFNPPPFADTEEFCARLRESDLALFPRQSEMATTILHSGRSTLASWHAPNKKHANNFKSMAVSNGYGDTVTITARKVSMDQSDFIALSTHVRKKMEQRQPFRIKDNVCLQILVRSPSGTFESVPSGTRVSIDMNIAFEWQEWADAAAPGE